MTRLVEKSTMEKGTELLSRDLGVAAQHLRARTTSVTEQVPTTQHRHPCHQARHAVVIGINSSISATLRSNTCEHGTRLLLGQLDIQHREFGDGLHDQIL